MTGNLGDVAMVNKSVDDCVGNDSIAENIRPFLKRLIGGEYGRSVFIPCGNKLKETKCSSLINRQITDFVLWEVVCYEKLSFSYCDFCRLSEILLLIMNFLL